MSDPGQLRFAYLHSKLIGSGHAPDTGGLGHRQAGVVEELAHMQAVLRPAQLHTGNGKFENMLE